MYKNNGKNTLYRIHESLDTCRKSVRNSSSGSRGVSSGNRNHHAASAPFVNRGDLRWCRLAWNRSCNLADTTLAEWVSRLLAQYESVCDVGIAEAKSRHCDKQSRFWREKTLIISTCRSFVSSDHFYLGPFRNIVGLISEPRIELLERRVQLSKKMSLPAICQIKIYFLINHEKS